MKIWGITEGIMDTKGIDTIQTALNNVLNNIEQPLKIIALLKLADEFYSKEERKKYYGELNIIHFVYD